MAGMADHPHTIDRWDDATGENLIEQIAAVGDYLVALETYRAAVKRWPKDRITLRNRARVNHTPVPPPPTQVLLRVRPSPIPFGRGSPDTTCRRPRSDQ